MVETARSQVVSASDEAEARELTRTAGSDPPLGTSPSSS